MTHRWLPARSLAARIALASSLVGLAVAFGAGLFGYWALIKHLDERAATELKGRHEQVVHVLRETTSIANLPRLRYRFHDIVVGHEGLHVALTDARSGEVIESFSATATRSTQVLQGEPDGPELRHWLDGRQRQSSIRDVSRLASGQQLRVFVTMGRALDDEIVAHYVQASLLGLPLLLVVVAGGSWGVARTGLAPLTRFNQVAASVGAGSLDQRLAVEDLPAELAELAREFNGMLDRIDAGYQRLQRFSGDLSHELRTPLAILLGRTQVALSQRRSEQQLREVLEGNEEELERLARLIDDMLFMAHADHGSAPLTLEEVRLGEEARRVADYLSLLAEERDLAIEVQGDATVRADRLLVQRAVTNLLSNAIRHADRQSTIRIAIHSEAGQGLLVVGNRGAPIAPDHLQRIFDRFYRVDPGRRRTEGGAGLGLAIVKTIMEAHRGTVGAASQPGGTTEFTLRFPGAGRGPAA